MGVLSTREAAKRLGIAHATLVEYVHVGKVPTPQALGTGTTIVYIWTDDEVEHIRKLLPKIANGRKTRWQRQREKQGTQAGASPPQPRQMRPGLGAPAPALQKTKKQTRKPKKKK